MTKRRWVLWGSQIGVAVAVTWFIVASVRREWETFRALEWDVRVQVLPLLAAFVIVLVTYALLIAAWRAVIRGWGAALNPSDAVRIWTWSNLGRYLPGKVWSVAGLVVLAQRVGVDGWIAAGAAIVMQALALGSAAVVAALAAPGALESWQLVVAATIAAVTLGVLTSSRALAVLQSIAGRTNAALPGLRVTTAITALCMTALSWVLYGVAFWLLASALLPHASVTPGMAVGVFTVGYATGLLALFAPGGVGVREAVMVTLLAPATGAGGAIVVAVASRLLLTITEVAAAAIATAVPGATVRDDALDAD